MNGILVCKCSRPVFGVKKLKFSYTMDFTFSLMIECEIVNLINEAWNNNARNYEKMDSANIVTVFPILINYLMKNRLK